MEENKRNDYKMESTIARIHAKVLASVLAAVFGLTIFIMTVWLLIKGGPEVGTHLSLLGEYFIGYSVTWSGSIIGLLYGALVGWIIGWVIGIIYNRVVKIRNNL